MGALFGFMGMHIVGALLAARRGASVFIAAIIASAFAPFLGIVIALGAPKGKAEGRWFTVSFGDVAKSLLLLAGAIAIMVATLAILAVALTGGRT